MRDRDCLPLNDISSLTPSSSSSSSLVVDTVAGRSCFSGSSVFLPRWDTDRGFSESRSVAMTCDLCAYVGPSYNKSGCKNGKNVQAM